MSLLSWPAGLPQPVRSRHVPNAERVFRTAAPGPYSYKGKERDYSGVQELEFFLDATMAAVFWSFWKDTLLEGGVWFNCSWPAMKQGGLVVCFLTVPNFKHVYNGAYRVSVVAQVRGASQPVQYSSDPFFPNVTLLLHGDDTASTVFTDSSQYHRSPTSVNGGIINNADSSAFALRSISCFTTTSYLQYSYAASAANEPFTLEFRYKINQSTGAGDGFADPRGEFIRLASGATLVVSANGFINSLVTHLFALPAAVAVDWAAFGLLAGTDRVNVAICREVGNAINLYFNYRYAGTGSYSGTVDTVYIGNRGLSSRTTAVSIEEVRYTSGVARYTRGLANLGDRVVPIQSAPFPNQS